MVTMVGQDASMDADLARTGRTRLGRVAVVAHTGKTLGGGLDELRRLLTGDQIGELDWAEVPKSRKAPAKVRHALHSEPDLLVIWGGDGMVQRCVDVLAAEGSDVPVAIIPAGTANLFATNLGIPHDLPQAVRVALRGGRRRIDAGRFNGEHFAVMAGVGFDADMIDEADGALKARLGRLAYLWTGAHALDTPPVRVRIKLDGAVWFEGDASCVLIGNVPKVFGPVEVFEDATPDDGWLDVGVATAQGAGQWARTLARVVTGPSDRSPYVRTAQARRISVRLAEPMRYELDGGSRSRIKRIKARVVPGAVTVCVPRERH
jgi:diacylglycerol kinase (ATP)